MPDVVTLSSRATRSLLQFAIRNARCPGEPLLSVPHRDTLWKPRAHRDPGDALCLFRPNILSKTSHGIRDHARIDRGGRGVPVQVGAGAQVPWR